MTVRSIYFVKHLLPGLLCVSLGAAANTYEIVDLGKLAPIAINNAGEVVANNGLPGYRASVFRNDKWHKLSPQSQAFGLNDDGYVVGDRIRTHTASLWKPGGATKTVLVPQPGNNSRATAINSDRVIVGYYFVNVVHCFIKTPGRKALDMGLLPGGNECIATAINDAGEVTGAALVGVSNHAFIWQNGKFNDLGVLPGTDATIGRAINADGVVVGEAQSGGNTGKAFMWDGVLTDFDPDEEYESTVATAINQSRTVVGWAIENQGDKALAARFTTAGPVLLKDEVGNLGDWSLSQATGINDSGVIVGCGVRKFDGRIHGFELIPD